MPGTRTNVRPTVGESGEALSRRITVGRHSAAACASAPDPEAWFPPPRAEVEELLEPLSWCASCPVRRSCLAAGLLSGEAGLWGGVQDHDRAVARARLVAGEPVDDVLDWLLADPVELLCACS